jgi:hypothetical protein
MDKIPKRLGKYEVAEEIDRGSMGIVYLGYDPLRWLNHLTIRNPDNVTGKCSLMKQVQQAH